LSSAVSLIDVNQAIDLALLAMLVVLAAAIVITRKLLAAILLMGIYSLISAVWYVVLDAVDVAFTEAVVGAGVSTIVLLGAILLTRAEAETVNWRRLVFPALTVFVVGALLIYAALDLPSFGDPVSPSNAYVGRAYLEATPGEVGTPNVVTAVLSSYRGFDTLGETVVIFAAGVGAAMLLGFGERAMGGKVHVPPGDHGVVLRVVARLFIPLILLFAFYVQFHGDLGPGGGFQAGVILAVAVILHALVFGLRETMVAVRPGVARGAAAIGVLLYAGVGFICVLNGGAFLDYDYLFPPGVEAQIPPWLLGDPDHPHHWGQHFGILLIELGVLCTVAATMITLFYGFAGRAAAEDPELELVDFIEAPRIERVGR
jgi:multicomponent Na+:H+ antiporter subunit B